jgi:beta-lactamase class A
MHERPSVRLLFSKYVGFISVVILAASLCARAEESRITGFRERMVTIEHKAGGRLGVAALDTRDNRSLEYRSGERFAMCSTFKVLLVSAVLVRVDARKETLDRRLTYDASDLLEYAPITQQHVKEGGMTIAALCAAAIENSDNTATNLLLNTIGGPSELTRYLRSWGDAVTRLDRNELSLNINSPGDERDTTSPRAMLDTMKKLLIGDVLSVDSRNRLTTWMIGCRTGASKLRAGINPTWRIGDKTGMGENGATNDIAIIWPPDRPPIFVTVYFSDSRISTQERNAVIAEVGRVISGEFAQSKRQD